MNEKYNLNTAEGCIELQKLMLYPHEFLAWENMNLCIPDSDPRGVIFDYLDRLIVNFQCAENLEWQQSG